MTIKDSPFGISRFEYEGTHLYYLPEDIFKRLEGPKPVFVIGSRGTGKTTLLKALSWEEQLQNRELREKLSEIKAGEGYLGIYIRLPETLASVFNKWISHTSEDLRGTIFCLYIDLIWTQSLLEAVTRLILNRTLKALPQEEYAITDVIKSKYPELVISSKGSPDFSFKRFASMIYDKRRNLEKWALANAVLDQEILAQSYPLAGPGDFGRTVGALMSTFCISHQDRYHTWQFKVCLDESECLSRWQQRALNTSVRLLRDPISFVISYVRTPEDLTTTLQENMTLQEADRDLIALDDMSDKQFIDLAEGVARIRIEKKLERRMARFKTRAVLGSLSINNLLLEVINSSAAPESKRLLRRAQEFSEFFRNVPDDSDEDSSTTAPPIFQAYLIDRLNLELHGPDSERWKKRKQQSAELRKRMVAAYLSICKELRRQGPKYASADMVIQMSDKCIRDYLNQMDAIFEEANMSVSDFCEAHIDSNKQDAALRAASNRKKDAIPKSEVGSPLETLRLIDALGRLTARVQTLQTTTARNRALITSELGLFVIDVSQQSTELYDTMRLVIEASEAGFLKIRKLTNKIMEFRVHCSLAAAYGFSYRGAYYPCPLKLRDILTLYEDTDNERRSDFIASLGDRLLNEPLSLNLFEEGL